MSFLRFEIETPRLLLRTPDIGDAKSVHSSLKAIWDDLQLWMSWAHEGQDTYEAELNYIQNIVPEQISMGAHPLFGFSRMKGSLGRFVVSTGINANKTQLETGYWVAREFRHQGLGTEATNASIRF